MALRFEIDANGNVLTVKMSGRLTLGPQLRIFGDQVAAKIAIARPIAVLLDLAGLEEVDSAGLGELVILYTTTGEYGSRLGLVRPPARVLRLLETTRLTGLLPHFANEREAGAWIANQ